ncbi:MAG: phosphoserine phosphatase rsbX [Acidobacteria bacterium]|nr:phosphoserine phosphatase rsbX [Acidobacteriota bacterium]
MEVTAPPGSLLWTSLGSAVSLDIDDVSQVAAARRAAQSLAAELGFDETLRGRAAIVATECATNVARHGRGGQLHLRVIGSELELLAVDRGPGMADVSRCLEDGFSTGGTAGTGLGAVRRLSQTFDLHSAPGRGTVVLSRIGPEPRHPQPTLFVSGGMWLPAPGESECGDACLVQSNGATLWALLADGLGHGTSAAAASSLAVQTFANRAGDELPRQVEDLHLALRATRGAALAVARIDAVQGTLEYAGVGNIASTVRDGAGSTGLVSMNGTVGHQLRKIQPFNYRWGSQSILIMHSDGLQSHWSVDAEPGLALRHPAVIAAVLVRSYGRGRDDVSVVVVKQA